MLQSTVAIFADVPSGFYTVLARHSSLSPAEARQDIALKDSVMLGVKFIYSDLERRLIRIELQEELLDV